MKIEIYQIPSHFLNYLFNGEIEGITEKEQSLIEEFMHDNSLGAPLSCESIGFIRYHDLYLRGFRWACDCENVTFPKL